MSGDSTRSNLPVLRPIAGRPDASMAGPGPTYQPTFYGLPVPKRLARLGNVLAFASLVLVTGGVGGWAALGSDVDGNVDEHGPWPLVLAAAFCLGILGAGCGLIALGLGSAARRQAVGALCVSLVRAKRISLWLALPIPFLQLPLLFLSQVGGGVPAGAFLLVLGGVLLAGRIEGRARRLARR